MKILISGVCGFVGSTLAETLLDDDSANEIVGSIISAVPAAN
jgi:nucleoside-diphosphate-sugar epimerase